MAATARDRRTKQKPVYHFSISFDYDDPADRALMLRVADRLLADLKMQGYQALMVAHRDRAHAHLHIVVNRIHPEDLTVWSNWNDYRRIERSLRAQEAELGLRVVPGHHAPVFDEDGNRLEPARLVRGDADFLERVRAEAGPHLASPGSWAELERELAAHGLRVRMKGRGMVVTDGKHEVKASKIDPAFSRSRLEADLGIYGEYRLRQQIAARTLDERAARLKQAVVADASPERFASAERTPEVTRVAAPVQREAPPTVSAPKIAGAFPAGPPDRDSVQAQAPEPSIQPPQPRPAESPAPVQPPVLPEEAPDHPPAKAVEPIRPVLPSARPVEPVVPIRKRTRPLTEREHYRTVLQAFNAELAALYRDPRAARRAFSASLDEISPEAAVRVLESSPRRYGSLRLGADVRRAAEAARWAELYARAQVEGTRAYARYAVRLFRRAEAIEEADRVLREAKRVEYSVGGKPSLMADRARKADEAEHNVGKWLREIYEFPTRAQGQIDAYRSAHGREAMERVFRESPELFGELRSDKRRLLVLRDTTEAQWKAGSYAIWLGGAFAAIEARPTRTEHESAQETARAAQQKVDAARRAREALGNESASKVAHDAALILQIAAQGNPDRARRLNRQLAAMLPASTVQLARKAIQLAEGPSDTGQSRNVRRGGYDFN
jgi:hypothetical protein